MNSDLQLIRLKFTSPLHLHGHSLDYSESHHRIHSDTLYAAIMQMWHLLGNQRTLDAINTGHLDWAISSLFPYVNGETGDKIYFLPRLRKMFDPDGVNRQFKHNKKLLKKIEWLDLGYFAEHVSKIGGASPMAGHIRHGKFLSKSDFGEFLTASIDPHARIPREETNGAKTTPYFTERLRFAENSGMYFLFSGDEKAFSDVQKALNLLQDEGIGSDRTLGNGRFLFEIATEEEIKPFQALFEESSEYSTNLSLFLPESKDQLASMMRETADDQPSRIAYELKKRGGWITTEPFLTLQKQAVFMFSEGSIFKNSLGIAGNAVSVSPKMNLENVPKVTRIGKSLFVPIKF